MSKEKIYAVALGVIVLAGFILFFKQELIDPNQESGDKDKISVEISYPEKLIYQTNELIELEKYQTDCQVRGGSFNECGNTCVPGSDVCAKFCVYTCEFNAEPIETPEPEVKITSFEECLAAGNPIMESYPRQCLSGEESFTENIGNTLEMSDMIQLVQPQPNQEIFSPLTIQGQAKGNWFFEASAPVVVVDWDGLIIGQGYISAQGDWMTEDFIEFTGEIEFENPVLYDYGSLILQKANPSDLPANDAALEIPVRFGN
jgi:hypothetical protein